MKKKKEYDAKKVESLFDGIKKNIKDLKAYGISSFEIISFVSKQANYRLNALKSCLRLVPTSMKAREVSQKNNKIKPCRGVKENGR